MGSDGAFERRKFELKLLNKDKVIRGKKDEDLDVFKSYLDEVMSTTSSLDHNFTS